MNSLLTRTVLVTSAVAALLLLGVSTRAQAAGEQLIADTKGCKVIENTVVPGESIAWSGACVNGVANGEGRLQWSLRGKSRGAFTGMLTEGHLEGNGLFEYADGDRYEGGFYAGKYEGRGVYTFANGNRFDGEFVDGASTRRGHLQLTDGQRFESDFILDRTDSSPGYGDPANLLFLCFPEDKDPRFGLFVRSPNYATCNGQAKRMRWSSPYYLAPPTLLVLCFSDGKNLSSVAQVRSSGYPLYDAQAVRMVRIRAMAAQQGVGDPLPGCHMVGVAFAHNETDFFFSQN